MLNILPFCPSFPNHQVFKVIIYNNKIKITTSLANRNILIIAQLV